MLVAWNDEHASGFDIIDAGHRLMIEAINRLNNCGGGERHADRQVVGCVLDMLHAHLPKQFHHEETLMMMARSGQLADQRTEHASMMAALDSLTSAFHQGEDVVNLLLLNLVAFLKSHMRGTDRAEFGPDLLCAA